MEKELLAVVLALAVLLSLWGARSSFRRSEVTGARLLAATGVSAATYAAGSLWMVLSTYATLPDLSTWFGNVGFVAGAVYTAVFFFLLAMEYTGLARYVTRRSMAALCLLGLFLVALFVMDPYLGLYWESYEVTGEGNYGVLTERGPGSILLIAALYALLSAASLLFVRFALLSPSLYRYQSAALLVAVLVPFGAHVSLLFGPLSVDLTPVAMSISASAVWLAMFRFRLTDIGPIALRTVFENVSVGVCVLDREGRVVDLNAGFEEMLGVSREVMGAEATEVFTPLLPREAFESATVQNGTTGRATGDHTRTERYGNVAKDREVSVSHDGRTRYYDLRVSEITDTSGRMRGRLLILRDITLLKERESELDLMRQVQSRVLRHNIRNELQTVQASNELLQEAVSDDHQEVVAYSSAAVDSLLATSEKARVVEELVERDSRRERVDVAELLRESMTEHQERFPAVTFQYDGPERCQIRTEPAVRYAFTNLIENAAKHNTASDPRIEVRVARSDASLTVEIEDNGPAIPSEELEVLERAEETSLKHGSGIGLWIVDWVIQKASGDIVFETTEAGNLVRVTVPQMVEEETS